MPEVYRAFDAVCHGCVSLWRADGRENEVLHACNSSWLALPAAGSSRKQLEREAARCAAVSLLGSSASGTRILKTAGGQPILEGDSRYVSLSHSKGWGAAALATHPVGVDLEWIDWNRSLQPAERFMNPAEYAVFRRSKQSVLHYFLLWSIKEGIYKLVSHRFEEGLSFQRHLDVALLFDPVKQSEGLARAVLRHPLFCWHGSWWAVRISGFWLTWGTFRP